MSGHTQQVIRHLPEENKLKKTRNLDRQPYSQRTAFNLYNNTAFYSIQCSLKRLYIQMKLTRKAMDLSFTIQSCHNFMNRDVSWDQLNAIRYKHYKSVPSEIQEVMTNTLVYGVKKLVFCFNFIQSA